LVQAASAILAHAERRAEIIGQNIANASAPAYKRRVAFVSLVNPADARRDVETRSATAVDFRQGKLVETGNSYDLAIGGRGFFALREEAGVRFTRDGRFTRREDGRLVDPSGGVLQLASGEDVVVGDAGFDVQPDGRILAAGTEAGRIAVFDAPDPAKLAEVAGGFSDAGGVLELTEQAGVTQGAYEASNVSVADEMVAMMESLRMAEAGQRVMLTYDDLMGRVISSFGESVR
jgi:flagellar basal-body rod protein FlgG